MPSSYAPDTIVALSTPPGRSGIGVVRLSGPAAVHIARWLIKGVAPLEHSRARLVHLRDVDAADPDTAPPLDEAVVTAFLAPRSYTGEDVVEIAAHGAPVILDALVRAALGRGARVAMPGEFTQRAFLAGRLDLTEAEAIHDLIAAHTLEQARSAAQQLGGSLSRRVTPMKERLLRLLALLEAGMDFAAGELDDVDVVAPAHIATEITALLESLEQLAGSFRAGSLLRNGASLALVGRPNAGKSSLFNRLLERPRAIVTPTAGTTRDTLEEAWSLNGIPIRLIDTAGLRSAAEGATDEAERQGIERTRESLADADVVLLVHDATEPRTADEEALARTLQGRPHLLVRNKVDLLLSGKKAEEGIEPADAMQALNGERMLNVSALTGEGLELLRAALLMQLNTGGGVPESGALNNQRQYEAVLATTEALERAAEANASLLPHELLLIDLHAALSALDALTGATTADDILARIFSSFCIGK